MAETVIFLNLVYDGEKVAKGNSEAAGFDDQIEIESFSWGIKAVHKAEPDGNPSRQAAVKPTLTPRSITFTKFYDKSSTKVANSAAKRKHVQLATLTFAMLTMTEKGNKAAKVMEMKMSDGYIEGVSVSATESGKAIAIKEEITLSFTACDLSYFSVENDRKTPATFSYRKG